MLITLILILPFVFALALALAPRSWIKPLSLGFSLSHVTLAIPLLRGFSKYSSDLQFVEKWSWIPQFNINYFVGIDGISLWLVILTLLLQPIILLASWNSIQERWRGFAISSFLLQSAMIGTFVSLDAVLFYTFWEFSLIPMYFMIGIWGGSNRIYATLKFFLYTMAGSILMLVGMVTLAISHRMVTGEISTSLLDWYQLRIPFVMGEFWSPQTLLFIVFLVAFLIKTPAFPVHTWLPYAHVEAPTAGSVILAGVMLKMGTYGIVRWVVPLFPDAVQAYGWIVALIGSLGIVYGAMMAFVQTDIKKLIAYSSVSHMGYVLVGIFTLNKLGVFGAIYQMLNHGVSTGALFLMIGMIYERTHTRKISEYGGLASILPNFTIFFLIFTLSSIAVPLTNGFVGEFMILMGLFQFSKPLVVISVLGVILGAVYMLWLVMKVFFGPIQGVVRDPALVNQDVGLREAVVLFPLAVLVFVMGIFPTLFTEFMATSIDFLVENFRQYSLSVR